MGGAISTDDWLDPLNRELSIRGHETSSADDVITPDYSHCFDDLRDPLKVLRTWTKPESATYQELGDDYILRRVRLNERLKPYYGSGNSAFSIGPRVSAVPNFGPLTNRVGEARQYAKSSTVRNNIWRVVLDHLPIGQPIILIGHSLGSVVAVDLLPRLRSSSTVLLLVTIGSPLGTLPTMREHSFSADEFPYDRVRSWVNVYDPRDFVTGGRGVAPHFPAALDAPVRTPNLYTALLNEHGASAYASQPVVTHAILEAMLGGVLVKTEPAPLAKRILGMEIPLLKALYSQQLRVSLDADKRDRKRALDLARDAYADQFASASKVTTGDAAALAPLEPQDFLRDPGQHLRGLWADDQLVPLALALAMGSPVEPFDIETDPFTKSRRQALVQTLNRLRTPDTSRQRLEERGESSNVSDQAFADQILEGLTVGRKAMGVATESRAWLPIALVGAGGIALAATGFGLIAAAPAGLAGAAVLTSTLAAFGPGGMMGGIVTLAALSSLGSGLVGSGVGVAGALHPEERQPAQDAINDLLNQTVLDSTPEQLRHALAAAIAVVSAQEQLGFTAIRTPLRFAVEEACAQAELEIELHSRIDPKSRQSAARNDKLKLLFMARDWLGTGADLTSHSEFVAALTDGDPTAIDQAMRTALALENSGEKRAISAS